MSRGRDVDVTVRVQLLSMRETSPARATGAGNVEPSMRAMTASLMSRAVRTVGGAAGSSRRSTLSAAIASTTAEMTADTTAGPLARSTAPTVAGIAAASATIVGLSIRAGRQRTAAFVVRLCDRDSIRSVGTIEPAAARRTPSSATRASHSTPAPTPSRPWPPLTATSQPSASLAGIASASAFDPPGSWTGACSSQPSGGPPIASRRRDKSS